MNRNIVHSAKPRVRNQAIAMQKLGFANQVTTYWSSTIGVVRCDVIKGSELRHSMLLATTLRLYGVTGLAIQPLLRPTNLRGKQSAGSLLQAFGLQARLRDIVAAPNHGITVARMTPVTDASPYNKRL